MRKCLTDLIPAPNKSRGRLKESQRVCSYAQKSLHYALTKFTADIVTAKFL